MPRKRNPDAKMNSPRIQGGKRDVVVTFKTNDSLKSALQVDADKSKRTLSAEIEFRLEQSLLGHHAFAHLFGDTYTMDRLMILATGLKVAEMQTGRPWWVDRRTFEAGKANVIKALDMWLMPGEGDGDEWAESQERKKAAIAAGAVTKIGKGTLYGPFPLDTTPAKKGKKT